MAGKPHKKPLPPQNPVIVEAFERARAAAAPRVPLVAPALPVSPHHEEQHLWPRNETEIDLPGEPPPPFPALNPEEPLFVGCVTAHQRGVAGELSLELLLGADHAELGGYVLDGRQTRRLWKLLGIVVYILSEAPPTPPTPPAEAGRGITGWDLQRSGSPSPNATLHPHR